MGAAAAGCAPSTRSPTSRARSSRGPRRGRGGLRRRPGLPRTAVGGRPTRRGAGPRSTPTGPAYTWANATARSSAGTRRSWRRRPSPAASDELLTRDARRGGPRRSRAAAGYEGAGTAEFLLAADGAWCVPGDERAAAGRAPRHRGRDRHRPRARAARGGRRASRSRIAQDDVRPSATRSRHASTRRTRRHGFLPATGRVELLVAPPLARRADRHRAPRGRRRSTWASIRCSRR